MTARTLGARAHWQSPLWAVATAVAAIHGIVAFVLLDPQTLLSVDAAVKLLQSRSLLASGWRSVALSYPGAGIDPGGVFFPFVAPFAFRIGAEWHGIFPTSVALLNALVVSLGARGVALLSVVASGVTMAAATALSIRQSRFMIPVTLGVATCFWFYAVLPWEHVPAAALSTLAFAFALCGETTLGVTFAGLLLGSAAVLRDESLLLVPGLLWAGARKGARPSTLGFTLAACILPVVLAGVIDPLLYGRPGAAHFRHAVDPFRWVGVEPPAELPRIPQVPLPRRYDIVMHEWLLGFRGVPQSLFIVASLLAIAAVRQAQVRAVGVLLVVCVVAGLHLRDLTSLVRQPDFVAGLLRLSPVLIFAALPTASAPRVPSNRLTLLLTTGVFLAGMLLLVNTTGGASLGPRLLIPVLPLLAVAAWEGLDSYREERYSRVEYRFTWLIGLALLLGSIVMQAGVAARAYVAFNRSERQAVRWLEQSAEPIVVDSTFTVSVAEPVYTERLVFLAQDQPHASDLAVTLANRGFASLLLVSREQQQRLVFPPFRLIRTRRTMHTVVQQWVR